MGKRTVLLPLVALAGLVLGVGCAAEEAEEGDSCAAGKCDDLAKPDAERPSTSTPAVDHSALGYGCQ
jgi:hypothetical protein